MDINLRPFEIRDYLNISNMDLREQDKKELKASLGNESETMVIFESVIVSDDVHIIENEDTEELLGIFGVAGDLNNYGAVWLLTQGEFSNHALKIIRYIKKCLNKWEKQYSILYNFIDVRRSDDFKFLETLGFTIEKDYYHFFHSNGHPFFRFYKKGACD